LNLVLSVFSFFGSLVCRTEIISFISVLKKQEPDFIRFFGSVSSILFLGYFGSTPRFQFFLSGPSHHAVEAEGREVHSLSFARANPHIITIF
jgi:hypothetical protein